ANLLLIPRFGAGGAATSSLLSYSTQAVLAIAFGRRAAGRSGGGVWAGRGGGPHADPAGAAPPPGRGRPPPARHRPRPRAAPPPSGPAPARDPPPRRAPRPALRRLDRGGAPVPARGGRGPGRHRRGPAPPGGPPGPASGPRRASAGRFDRGRLDRRAVAT